MSHVNSLAYMSVESMIVEVWFQGCPRFNTPLTSLLWRHRSLEQRIVELEEQQVRLQRSLGRVIETICAWDNTLAHAFNLILPTVASGSTAAGGDATRSAGSAGAASRTAAEPSRSIIHLGSGGFLTRNPWLLDLWSCGTLRDF